MTSPLQHQNHSTSSNDTDVGKLLAGPLVLETFFKHFLSPKSATSKSKAREDLIYDEAFVLMKTFLETATKYPVAALQRFGLVRTPAPPWVALHRVIIPQQTLVRAAAFLVEAFGGDDMAYKVAGGTKWWQVRAGPGVEAEWIVMKKDWNDAEKDDKARRKASEGMVGEDGGVGENGECARRQVVLWELTVIVSPARDGRASVYALQ